MTNDHVAQVFSHIPTVTEEDLKSFHAKHFGDAEGPARVLISHENLAVEEDDGLGYYADGEKRTLTDDQIAIFRHSEVQAILRERRLAQDASEAHERRHGTRKSNVADETSTANLGPRNDLSAEQTKRKWEDFIDVSVRNPGGLTHRRMARELDELKDDSVDLAYGDDDLPEPPSRKPRLNVAGPAFKWPALGSASGEPAPGSS